MTESDWLNCTSPSRLLGWMPLPLGDRRWRLLACGICRQFERFEGDEALQSALVTAESFADGTTRPKQLDFAHRRADRLAIALTGTALGIMHAWQHTHDENTRTELAVQSVAAGRRATAARLIAACAADDPQDAFFTAPGGAGPERAMIDHHRNSLIEEQSAVVHDILGNPFRRAAIDPLWLAWRDGFIPGLARAIYEEERFEEMVILGDALEDAGCADQAILDHCHGPGPHVLGCWVLDRLLGHTAPPHVAFSEPLLTAWPEKYSTPLDPVIGTGVAEGGVVWVSLRIESAILPEPVRLVSEVNPEDLTPQQRPLLADALSAVKMGLRQGLAQFSPRGRTLGGTCVTLMRLVFNPPAPAPESLQSAARDALERALHEAVMVPLELRPPG
jgi:hypothetical protein